jgi:transglutaminase-like putative cysteine protease
MDTYFRTTSYALIAAAFVALALTGELDALSIALYSIAISVSFYRDARGVKRLRLREWMWRVLAFAYVPFIFVDAAMLSNRILALAHMTLFVSAAKLYQNKRDRDWVFLYLIAFFQMLLAAGLTFNATFVASLTVFLFFFISTLAAFEIRRARREVTSLDEEAVTPLKQDQRVKYLAKEATAQPVKRAGRVRYLVGASLAQVTMVVALTLPFFFIIPRFGGGNVGRGIGDSQAITGFSNKVELGQVASIKSSPRVVMRIQLDRPPARYLHWRGVALERYDGRSWFLDAKENRVVILSQDRRAVGEASDTDARFDRAYTWGTSPLDRQNLIDQKIILEPLDTPTLFASQKPVQLYGPVATLKRDRLTDALSADSLRGRTSYMVRSDISIPNDQELRADSPALAPKDIKQLYTQLPRKLDPRIELFAHEITRNAPTPYDKVRAIENELKTRFGYTLNVTIKGSDPLAEFLFDAREGHCEYFATAMVIMLRTLGIPARIVNGFQMGEYNDINRLYTVRESDAHSWVEVYFPHSSSWIEFDPTPAAGINDYSQGGMLARLRKYMDAMEVFWLDYIVTLDSEEQASMMVDLQHRLLSVKDRLLVYYTGLKQWMTNALGFLVDRSWSVGDGIRLGGAFGLLVVTLAALYMFLYIKRRGIALTGYGPWWHRWFVLPTWRSRRLVRLGHRESAVMFYEQMLAVARRAGMVKQPHQTPVEFADVSGSDQIREITALYNRVRFGHAPLDESEAHRVLKLLAELKQKLRRK